MPYKQEIHGAQMIKQRTWLLSIGVLSFCLVLYLFTMAPRDYRLRRYQRAFRQVQHPAGTRLVNPHSFVGVLDLTRVMYRDTFSQGCDYVVGEVREYSGTKESIEAFYAAQKITLDEGRQKPISTIIIPVNQRGLPDANLLTRDEAVVVGPGGVYIIDYLHNEYATALPRPPQLKTSGSYYFAFMVQQEFDETFPSAALDLRCN